MKGLGGSLMGACAPQLTSLKEDVANEEGLWKHLKDILLQESGGYSKALICLLPGLIMS